MRLQIIKQTLSCHGIRDKSDTDRLAAENRELAEKTSALKTELEGCHNLKMAYQEIKDTYNDISKGDYISKLIERNRALENSSSHDQDSLTQSPSVPTYDKKKPKLYYNKYYSTYLPKTQ